MELTDEQRRRIEENRLKAQAKLRQRQSMQQGAGTGQAAQRTSSETAAVIRKQPAAVTAGKAPSQTTGGASNSRDTVSARVDSSPQGTHDSGSFPQPPRTTSSRVGGGRAGATRAVAPLTGAGTSSKFGATPPPGQVAAGSNFAVAGIRNTRVECEGCAGAEGDGRVDRELLEEFGVTICRKCKLSREEYQFISKKEAKDTYLLPEGTIAILKFVERDNPHHSSWTKMKLYLRRDVMEYSYKRWGSDAALEAERGRRETLKFDRSLARTKGVFKRARTAHEDRHFSRGNMDDEE